MWIKIKDYLINMDKIVGVSTGDTCFHLRLYTVAAEDDYWSIEYDSEEERDWVMDKLAATLAAREVPTISDGIGFDE